MRDNLGGGELDPADDVHRRCKKNCPSVLSCLGKRIKEDCNRGSEVPHQQRLLASSWWCSHRSFTEWWAETAREIPRGI